MRASLASIALIGTAVVFSGQYQGDPDLHNQAIEIPGGSGVVVAAGRVLTAKHVVEAWRERGFEVGFAAEHPNLDVAVVEWPTNGKTAAQIAPGSTKRGQKVSLVGFIMGRSEVHTGGHTGFLRMEPGVSVHSCPSGPGASGSPLFDDQGRLVGVHVGAFFIPSPFGTQRSPAEGRFVEISAIRPWLESVLVD